MLLRGERAVGCRSSGVIVEAPQKQRALLVCTHNPNTVHICRPGTSAAAACPSRSPLLLVFRSAARSAGCCPSTSGRLPDAALPALLRRQSRRQCAAQPPRSRLMPAYASVQAQRVSVDLLAPQFLVRPTASPTQQSCPHDWISLFRSKCPRHIPDGLMVMRPALPACAACNCAFIAA